jgi:hypothetical protein
MNDATSPRSDRGLFRLACHDEAYDRLDDAGETTGPPCPCLSVLGFSLDTTPAVMRELWGTPVVVRKAPGQPVASGLPTDRM